MTRFQKLSMVLALVAVVVCPAFAAVGPSVFATPEDAAKALVDACERHDMTALASILGPDADELINSGDPVQDKARRDRFVSRAREALHVTADPIRSGRLLVTVGKDDWPVPLPLVKVTDGYRFDPAAAKSEILARRIGRNELNAIATLRDFADAELEYAYADLNRNGVHDYARQILSDPGQRNGLYWEAGEGEPESPLAKVVGRVVAAGYERPASGGPVIYRGYAFRLLEAQGPAAPGGARDYVVRGAMIGGFALVAYPLEYGVGGVKTFIVNHDGVVWERDLGPRTKAIASAMRRYNPGKMWKLSPEEAPAAAAGSSSVPR